MGLVAQSPPPNKDRRWCSHLPLDVVLEQLLVHAVELSTADVVEVVGDVAGVLLGAGAVRALEFPVSVLVVKVPWGTPGRVSTEPLGCATQAALPHGAGLLHKHFPLPEDPLEAHNGAPTSLILLLSATEEARNPLTQGQLGSPADT